MYRVRVGAELPDHHQRGATVASTVTCLLPVVAIVLGVLVLGQSITVYALAGIALILAGVALTRRRAKPAADEPKVSYRDRIAGVWICLSDHNGRARVTSTAALGPSHPDSILDDITLYWLTGTGATAAMISDYEVWHSSI